MERHADSTKRGQELQPYLRSGLPSPHFRKPAAESGDEDVHLRDYINVIMKRKRLVIIFLISAVITTMLISFLLTPL
ncbi:MAG: hypothetical protein FIA94_02255, partial [Nitrospirae bacterium]|nr:hypothetical protein [Nitrospirota bacterium]